MRLTFTYKIYSYDSSSNALFFCTCGLSYASTISGSLSHTVAPIPWILSYLSSTAVLSAAINIKTSAGCYRAPSIASCLSSSSTRSSISNLSPSPPIYFAHTHEHWGSSAIRTLAPRFFQMLIECELCQLLLLAARLFPVASARPTCQPH